jgi:hypothetical protein
VRRFGSILQPYCSTVQAIKYLSTVWGQSANERDASFCIIKGSPTFPYKKLCYGSTFPFSYHSFCYYSYLLDIPLNFFFGKRLSLSRFAILVSRNYILLIKTSLYMCALSRLLIGLCWCILRVILLGRISSNYLFLKWQYSSIGPQIMTNFVKIGTKNLLNPGKLIAASIDYWFLTLLHITLVLLFLQNCRRNTDSRMAVADSR